MTRAAGLTDLPIETSIDEIRAALAGPGCAVLQAPPGAGKTTVVPLRLLEEPWLGGRRILVLEPRRLATRAAATRMAALIGERVGESIGYSTRDERRVGPSTRIEVVTDGILTRRLQHDPTLPGVGLVIFDEIHERNLQTDLALALALDVRAGVRPDLRLLAMSATLDTARIAAVRASPPAPATATAPATARAPAPARAPAAGASSPAATTAPATARATAAGAPAPAPVVVSQGRQHPVAIRWAPPSSRRPPDDARSLEAAVVSAVVTAVDHHDGDVLVFLAGAGDIRRAQAKLAGALPDHVDVLPLFGALPAAEQDQALAGSLPGRRRVVLATDIAETSLTVEGVRVVVDSGQARSPRYDPGTGLTRLHTGPVSRSSADQRAGRAGRQGPGVAYRLWSEHQHAGRRPFPQAEITIVDLAGFVLELAVWGAAPAELTFLEPPPQASLDDGRALLVALGALDQDGARPTAEGRRMADLPLHPRLARMVTGASPLGLGGVACALAALLEDRDVLRGRPDEVEVDIAERVRLIADPRYRHPLVDRSALASARRRAAVLGRRAREAPTSGAQQGPVDPRDCGRVLALAYPDRIAQTRGRGRFRLRTGAGAWMAEPDPLAGEAFLVIAQLDADGADSRIRLAAALDPADLETAAGAPVTTVTEVSWNSGRYDVRATTTRSIDGLVLATTEERAPPGPAATATLLQHVRSTRLGALPWTDKARVLQQRVLFLRRILGDSWPDLSDTALLATIDDWLAPLLGSARDRAGLEKLDLLRALRARLGQKQLAELDVLAPASVAINPRRNLRIDYSTGQPTVEARIQDLFGTTRHPTIAAGRAPLVLQLLSPAGRPVQVTADLPGFWTGSYAAVRKEMAGRYPKHLWPLDPAAANDRAGGASA